MPIKTEQKTIKQHPVPQNIMDVEFKLIGDLTMRQFTYLVVFGVIAYIVYISVVGAFKWPLVLFFTIFGLALAFVPIQERGMDEWVVNFFKAAYMPTQRVWKKEPVLPIAFSYQNIALVRQELITLAPTSSRRKLEEYLEVQQKAQIIDKLDIPEKEYILKVRQAYAPVVSSVEVQDVLEEHPIFEAYEKEETIKEEIPYTEETPQPLTAFTPQVATTVESQKAEVTATSQVPASPIVEKKEDVKASHPIKKAKPTKPLLPMISDSFTLSPITPDRHSGRRFTRMLPSEGQLILPVRGEKVLQTSEELDIQKDIDDKTEQLKKLLDQIKSDKDLKGVLPTAAVSEKKEEKEHTEQQQITEAESVVKKVKEENERLANEILKMKSDIEKSQASEEEKKKKQQLLEELQKEQKQSNTDYTSLQKQVMELQTRLKEKDTAYTNPQDNQPKTPTYAKMQAITNDPNIISGVVNNNNGEAIPGIVLLIKNHKGESVRALKTNTIGQFSISTPLVNGLYTLEIGSSVKGLTFDIITVEVRGEVIPPIEIVGRLV